MPYPLRALRMGEMLCRDALGPNYTAYEVTFCHGRLGFGRIEIIAGSLKDVELGIWSSRPYNVPFFSAKVHPYWGGKDYESDYSVNDRNVIRNRYNDHYLFTSFDAATEYAKDCFNSRWMRDATAKTAKELHERMQFAAPMGTLVLMAGAYR